MSTVQFHLQADVSGCLQARDRRRKTNRRPIETSTFVTKIKCEPSQMVVFLRATRKSGRP